MSLDPQLMHVLDGMPAEFETPIDWSAVRLAWKTMEPILAGPAGVMSVKAVEQFSIDAAGGAPDVRVYWPEGEPTMTVIHFHGGGWTLGNLDSTDHTARRICSRLGAIVVSCTYRLAPEHAFPTAVEDALLATKWALSKVRELGGDPQRVVIAGDSAGGNLVAAVTLTLRDEARQSAGSLTALPSLRAQLLLYPGVDVRDGARTAPSFIADLDPSIRSIMIEECIGAYLQGGDRGDWRVSPLAAEDLSGLPPALVVVLRVDPLRDQAVAYAARLTEAQVDCEVIEFPHLTHGFCHIGGIVPAAGVAFDEVLSRFAQFVKLGNGGKQ
jgi:acetyl esterase